MASKVARPFKGFCPVIRAREGRILGVHEVLDGPVFATMDDAIIYCIGVMASHFDRKLGLSDATIEPFDGMLPCLELRTPVPHTRGRTLFHLS